MSILEQFLSVFEQKKIFPKLTLLNGFNIHIIEKVSLL
jgi:hypothetical protein